jgi:dishevelled associated activator of morphogenesis
MKKRTIERKSKDGFLNSMAKNLGLKPKEEQKTETVREFDDLIETLRTGEKKINSIAPRSRVDYAISL